MTTTDARKRIAAKRTASKLCQLLHPLEWASSTPRTNPCASCHTTAEKLAEGKHPHGCIDPDLYASILNDGFDSGIKAARYGDPAISDELATVLGDVVDERARQDAKWGEQNHPNGTGPAVEIIPSSYPSREGWDASALADELRKRTDAAFNANEGTFEHILTEEWGEAVAEEDPINLRRELVQLAAVAAAWIEKLDREEVSRR